MKSIHAHVFILFCCDQGGWEDDETVLEAACREAFEEAGVKGTLRVCSINLSICSFLHNLT